MAGLIALCHILLDFNSLILGKYHFLLYVLVAVARWRSGPGPRPIGRGSRSLFALRAAAHVPRAPRPLQAALAGDAR